MCNKKDDPVDPCKWIHPFEGDGKIVNIKCKYGAKCINAYCCMIHPPERDEYIRELQSMKCVFDFKCPSHPERRGNCVRQHTPLKNVQFTLCPYDWKCHNHPERFEEKISSKSHFPQEDEIDSFYNVSCETISRR